MKKLILIRHGKSSWDQPLEDHERPLSNKGIFNNTRIFETIQPHLPERFLIWSSSAKRAHDTAKIFNEVSGIPQELDRKSTRLNSSHVRISYAVFCLKKKKNKN